VTACCISGVAAFVGQFFAAMGSILAGNFTAGLQGLFGSVFNGLISVGKGLATGIGSIHGALVQGLSQALTELTFGSSLFQGNTHTHHIYSSGSNVCSHEHPESPGFKTFQCLPTLT